MLARRMGRRTAGLRQRRPAARTQFVAIVRSGSTTLGSCAATVSSDPTTWRRAGHASDVARRQDVTTSMLLKTSFASPSWQDPI
jgi:hypothetical protein